MSYERIAHGGVGTQGLLLFALSCLGCNEVATEDSQGVEDSIGTDGGYLRLRDAAFPTPRDGGGLASMLPAKDAAVALLDASPGDAGQDAHAEDAALLLDSDGGSVEPNPTPERPSCKTLFYRDRDADGFGDPLAKVVSCTKPAGYVLVAGDCYDNNDRAHPGSTGRFLTHRGDGSFDFDCDGLETLARPTFAACPSTHGACAPGALGCNDDVLRLTWEAAEDGGWTDFRIVPCLGDHCPTEPGKVPACGQAGYWGVSVAWDLLSGKYACTLPAAGSTRIQTCR